MGWVSSINKPDCMVRQPTTLHECHRLQKCTSRVVYMGDYMTCNHFFLKSTTIANNIYATHQALHDLMPLCTSPWSHWWPVLCGLENLSTPFYPCNPRATHLPISSKKFMCRTLSHLGESLGNYCQSHTSFKQPPSPPAELALLLIARERYHILILEAFNSCFLAGPPAAI